MVLICTITIYLKQNNMKNAFKFSFLALIISLSVTACGGDSEQTDANTLDSTVVDSTVVPADSTSADHTMVDSAAKDAAAIDTTK
jgi:hypothetical protein